MKPRHVQFIPAEGEPAFVVLPISEYRRLLARAEGEAVVEPLEAAPVTPTAPAVPPATVDPDPAFDAATLVRLRKQAKLAQSQLARRSGVGLMKLIQIETGQQVPDAALRDALARALGVASL